MVGSYPQIQGFRICWEITQKGCSSAFPSKIRTFRLQGDIMLGIATSPEGRAQILIRHGEYARALEVLKSIAAVGEDGRRTAKAREALSSYIESSQAGAPATDAQAKLKIYAETGRI